MEILLELGVPTVAAGVCGLEAVVSVSCKTSVPAASVLLVVVAVVAVLVVVIEPLRDLKRDFNAAPILVGVFTLLEVAAVAAGVCTLSGATIGTTTKVTGSSLTGASNFFFAGARRVRVVVARSS